jgi:hypothetical protein
MIPDRLPEALRHWIARFPPGALQFEIGIQTFNPEVSKLISRRQDLVRLEDTFHFLRNQTGVHIHADLIAGLPGESLDSFANGFDRLVALRPHEIQVGILKRLRGTPIVRHNETFEMIYSPDPPYEILRNRQLDFATLQRLRRFSRYWDLVYNSGRFLDTAPLLWTDRPSPFHAFMAWSDWLYHRVGRRHGIALNRLTEFLFQYLTQVIGLDADRVGKALRTDFIRTGRTDTPPFLRPAEPFLSQTTDHETRIPHQSSPSPLPLPRHTRRQLRHLRP